MRSSTPRLLPAIAHSPKLVLVHVRVHGID
jgi:hypothetical protein